MTEELTRLPDVTIHVQEEQQKEKPLPPYGGRCEQCTAPGGVICDFPGESPDCPIHAGQQ